MSGLQAAKALHFQPCLKAEKLAHACSTVEERPFRAAKAIRNQ